MRHILIFLLLAGICYAEPALRTWTSSVGSTIEATLLKLEGGKVTLQLTTGKELTIPLTSLAETDQALVKEQMAPPVSTSIKGIDAKPGTTSNAIKCADSEWSYHVYLPPSFNTGREWPVLFIMSAGGGKGGNPIRRYIPVADQFDCILVCSVESKNGFDRSQAAVEAMAEDVYERFPVADKFAFATGMSGGGRMSYLLSECNKNVVGILPCGAGDGVYPDGESFRSAKLRSGTYIYSLVGTNCFNRTGVYESHQEFDEKCRLRFFPGGHAWAKEPLILEGMARVIGEELKENSTLAAYQDEYLIALEKLVLSIEDQTPWESEYLASFGASVNRSATAKRLAQKAKTLQSDPRVIAAKKAEQDIQKLCAAFYEEYDYFSGDTEDLPARSKMGAKLAANYSDTPYAEILTKLGEKSPAPGKK